MQAVVRLMGTPETGQFQGSTNDLKVSIFLRYKIFFGVSCGSICAWGGRGGSQ